MTTETTTLTVLLEEDLDYLQLRLNDAGSVLHEEFTTVKEEYFKFMILLFQNRHRIIGMYSDKVDALWHQHMLHSRKYYEFCMTHFEEYIHHDPAPYPYVEQEVQQRIQGFEFFKALYEEQFGDINPVWGRQNPAMCCGHHHDGLILL